LYEDGGEDLLVIPHRLGVAPVGLRQRLSRRAAGWATPSGATFGSAMGQVSAVGGGSVVSHHFARDRRSRTTNASGDLRVGEVVGQPQCDLLAFLLGEPASWHPDLLRGP
jgi:hypothetical protein